MGREIFTRTGKESVTIRLLLFAQLKEIFGEGERSIVLSEGTTGRAMAAELLRQKPSLEGVLRVSRLAVNCEYSSWDRLLKDGDEVAFILPVSGG